MLLATQANVETRLGRELTAGELVRLGGLLEEASALVEGYIGVTYTPDDEVPVVVAIVVSKIVARAIGRSADMDAIAATMESANSGPFGAKFRDSNIFLTSSDKLMLRPIGGRFHSVVLRSERGYVCEED